MISHTYIYEHAEKTGHGNVNIDHFETLSNGYRNNNSKENLQRHYILNMEDLLRTFKNNQCH